MSPAPPRPETPPFLPQAGREITMARLIPCLQSFLDDRTAVLAEAGDARWADDAAAPLSRHLRRAVLHLFADAAQGADVRMLARVIVDAWVGSAVAAKADAW